MRSALRIIDANANRAREALRVMEDAARFLLDDAVLAADLKALRHDVTSTAAHFGRSDAHRDIAQDVGTSITVDTERSRADVMDVVAAAGKRLGESLRAIEEYGKTIDAESAAAVEHLRYRGYVLEQAINAKLASARHIQWRLCVLLTERLCTEHDWKTVAEQVIEAGADCLQLREKDVGDRDLLARASWLVRAAAATETSIVVNDRPDIALMAGACGVHLGQDDAPIAKVRSLAAGRPLLIGISTSRIAEAERAFADGADYCGVGPMFPTQTKHKDTIVGPVYLKEYLAWGRLPGLAIGGITQENIGELAAVGCTGVAVSSAVCSVREPGAVVQELMQALARGEVDARQSHPGEQPQHVDRHPTPTPGR